MTPRRFQRPSTELSSSTFSFFTEEPRRSTHFGFVPRLHGIVYNGCSPLSFSPRGSPQPRLFVGKWNFFDGLITAPVKRIPTGGIATPRLAGTIFTSSDLFLYDDRLSETLVEDGR
jgi:hypothetical protein